MRHGFNEKLVALDINCLPTSLLLTNPTEEYNYIRELVIVGNVT